jgi:hypothetical protein
MSRHLLAFAAWVAANPQLLENEEKVARAYQDLFASPEGRIVLADLMARKGLLAPSYVLGASHADTAFFDGMKQVVAEILSSALINHPMTEIIYQNPGAPDDRHDKSIFD